MAAKSKSQKTQTPDEAKTLIIRAPQRGRLQIRVIGETPLIMHRWSEKVIKEMLDKQRGIKKMAKKEAKDPQQDYEDSMYRMPDDSGYAFPAVAFKAAMVSACREIDDLTMTQARQLFHVKGIETPEFVRINGTPRMRQDTVRVANGAADIRFRGEFVEWYADLEIDYNAAMLTASDVANLLSYAGASVGIGERRPEREGNSFGLFRVAAVDDQETIYGQS